MGSPLPLAVQNLLHNCVEIQRRPGGQPGLDLSRGQTKLGYFLIDLELTRVFQLWVSAG